MLKSIKSDVWQHADAGAEGTVDAISVLVF